MSFIREYELVSFDPASATMLINLYTYDSGHVRQITGDLNIPVVLPVDSTGNVPVGNELTAFLNRHAISITPDSLLESVLNLGNVGGEVLNANAIYNMTGDVEATEEDLITAPADALWIPVLIIPDKTFTPVGNVYTRSIVAAVGGNYGAPIMGENFTGDPQPKIGLPQYQIMYQHIIGSTLKRVHHAKSRGFAQEAAVNDVTVLTAPEYIVGSWPLVYNQPNLADILNAGGDINDYIHYYYLEHEELTIPTSYARGWIAYGP